MNTLKLLKTNKPNTTISIITWIFVFCGGKFYLDYILITNPISNNILIRLLYGNMRQVYTANNINKRYKLSIKLALIHIIAFAINSYMGQMLSFSNILINIYPIIVQTYIGYKCWYLKTLKVNNYEKTQKYI